MKSMQYSESTGLKVNRLFEVTNSKTILPFICILNIFLLQFGVSPVAQSEVAAALIFIAACQSSLELIASEEHCLKLIIHLSIMHNVL